MRILRGVTETHTLSWNSYPFKIFVNDEQVNTSGESGTYTFAKGDAIRVDNDSSVSQITINGVTYTDAATVDIVNEDIDIVGKFPGMSRFVVNITT